MPGALQTDAGAAAGAAAAAAEPATEAAVTGWQAVTAALSDYASNAREIGGDIGQSLVGAFQSAENAVGEFVKTGKLRFSDLVTSLLADLAKLAARRFILGPIANALSGIFTGAFGALLGSAAPMTSPAPVPRPVLHRGGIVGAASPMRAVSSDGLRRRAEDARRRRRRSSPRRGARRSSSGVSGVLSRREAQAYGSGGVNVTIMARDAESFRQSPTQVAADIARAVSLGR